ncbi:MAG: hypothetical protein K6C05_01170 [Anaerovibrio sp.]|nr:hypothetical protein [Anaerovibrio sp.]
MDDAIFKVNTPLKLSKIVDAMDEICSMMEELHQTDIRGDVYEYLLSKIAQSGVNFCPCPRLNFALYQGDFSFQRILKNSLNH